MNRVVLAFLFITSISLLAGIQAVDKAAAVESQSRASLAMHYRYVNLQENHAKEASNCFAQKRPSSR
jgi:hypothetical protein